MSISAQLPHQKTFIYRRINAIEYPKFIDDLNSSLLIKNPPSCLLDLLDLFFAISFAHYLIITPPSSPKPVNPLALLQHLGSPLKSSVCPKSARHRLERTYIASHSIFDLNLLRSATTCPVLLIQTSSSLKNYQ